MTEPKKSGTKPASHLPADFQPPTLRALWTASAAAMAGAILLLVFVILPAEYGIDPTGLGEIVGLRRMGEIKMQLEAEAERDHGDEQPSEERVQSQPDSSVLRDTAAVVAGDTPASSVSMRADSLTLSLEPAQGKEIKLTLLNGQSVDYRWFVDTGEVRYDAHGDSKAAGISYHNYKKVSSSRDTGSLTAAFDGGHGWFWRNRTAFPVRVTLIVSGPYSKIQVFD